MRNPDYYVATNITDIEAKALLVKFTREKLYFHYLNVFLKKFGTHSNISYL